MNKVQIGKFRNHLSRYLKEVREGDELIISDRETPIGRLIPFRKRTELESWKMTMPENDFSDLHTLSFPRSKVSASKELLSEREER